MYTLRFTPTFEHSYRKRIKKNHALEEKTHKSLHLLIHNPFYPSLKSHKVRTRNHKVKWSSRVTPDIRIIWDFDPLMSDMIYIYDIGGHTGKRKVYK